jgi:hypothetical protein
MSDDKRAERKRKLSEAPQEEFEETIHDPPKEVESTRGIVQIRWFHANAKV